MATLADLKTRIVTEMVRDDLLDDLAAQLQLHIQRACEHYADTRFWFNARVDWANTTPGSAFIDIPNSLRRVDRVTIPAQYVELQEFTLDGLEPDGPSPSGRPERYAYYNDQLMLDPVPNALYTLRLIGLARIAPPASDGASNAWTNEAQDLIAARVKATLYRSQYRDPAGAELAMVDEREAYDRLRRETGKRLKTPRRAELSGSGRPFNITTG